MDVKQNIFCESQRVHKTTSKGIIYFCGSPSSYIKYHTNKQLYENPPKSLKKAHMLEGGIARCPDSFCPSLNKLKKKKVHKTKFYMDKNKKIIKIKIEGNIYNYFPLR